MLQTYEVTICQEERTVERVTILVEAENRQAARDAVGTTFAMALSCFPLLPDSEHGGITEEFSVEEVTLAVDPRQTDLFRTTER